MWADKICVMCRPLTDNSAGKNQSQHNIGICELTKETRTFRSKLVRMRMRRS